MPELPDITVYVEALRERIQGTKLLSLRIRSPFLLRTALPPIDSLAGREVLEIRRLGKRIVFGFAGDCWLVLHLMVAGRLQWRARDDGASPRRDAIALFEFAAGTLGLTEAGTRRRASLHLLAGEAALSDADRGGLEVAEATLAEFGERLTRSNHTLKRALTDPAAFSGIGNAYSDEVLHRAGLSPVKLSQSLGVEEIARLHRSAQAVLSEWTERLRKERGTGFPTHVTAFRPGMAVHGRYGQPCPACGSRVERIRYAANETNYCPRCQTQGRHLANRGLSALLRKDWPRTPEEWEERKELLRGPRGAAR